MGVAPLFIFSITRSGSTLTQRVLSSYPEISTASEPWILMPLLAPLRPDLSGSADWHPHSAIAIGDFARTLPGGIAEYKQELRTLALSLYEKAAPPGASYFLDKTPAYFLIVDEIIDLFPDGKFIFLWRDPLGLLASLAETWNQGRWSFEATSGELFDGLPALIDSYSRHEERVTHLRFEDVVTGNAEAWQRVMSYLHLEFDPCSLTAFQQVKLGGRMGDPTGVDRYERLSTEPLDKWRAVIRTPIRRVWTRRYVKWLGYERLAVMGYDRDDLLARLDSLAVHWQGSAADAISLSEDFAREVYRARSRRTQSSSSWRHLLGGCPGMP